jgi:hypothetical protein
MNIVGESTATTRDHGTTPTTVNRDVQQPQTRGNVPGANSHAHAARAVEVESGIISETSIFVNDLFVEQEAIVKQEEMQEMGATFVFGGDQSTADIDCPEMKRELEQAHLNYEAQQRLYDSRNLNQTDYAQGDNVTAQRQGDILAQAVIVSTFPSGRDGRSADRASIAHGLLDTNIVGQSLNSMFHTDSNLFAAQNDPFASAHEQVGAQDNAATMDPTHPPVTNLMTTSPDQSLNDPMTTSPNRSLNKAQKKGVQIRSQT